MPRTQTIVKALRLTEMVKGKRVRPTAKQVADELGISERCAWRWLAALSEAHIATPPTVHDISAEDGL